MLCANAGPTPTSGETLPNPLLPGDISAAGGRGGGRWGLESEVRAHTLEDAETLSPTRAPGGGWRGRSLCRISVTSSPSATKLLATSCKLLFFLKKKIILNRHEKDGKFARSVTPLSIF